MLDQRARSRAELEAALERRLVPAEVGAAVLDRFTEVGLIDDASLAVAVAGAQHRERGLARRGVAQKLRHRGFEPDVVDAALESIDTEAERTRALDLVRRRQRTLAQLPAPVQIRRLVGLLGRKGYPSGLAFEVVRQVLAEAGQPQVEAIAPDDIPTDDLGVG